jgi:ABC-2 type transport system permease protein
LIFTFTGVLAQTLFQSSAMGIVSLIEDRENDFSQEIFVSPVSRYSIVFGKIVGETYVSMVQGIAIVIFAVIIGVQMTGIQFVTLIVVAIFVCIYGGSLGVIIMANLGNQRTANQIFPFIMLPQYFLAWVFTPIQNLPWYLEILSRISPMRYAVDLVRGVFYYGKPGYDAVVLTSPIVNMTIMTLSFLAFLAIGTAMFVRSERNR